MEKYRNILYIVLGVLGYLFWMNWQAEHPRVTQANAQTMPESTIQTSTSLRTNTTLFPEMHTIEPTEQHIDSSNAAGSHILTVTTDVLRINIDLQQGEVIAADLLAYPQTVNESKPVISLLFDKYNQRYVASSSLLVKDQGVVMPINCNFHAEKVKYQFDSPEQKTIQVVLHGTTESGLHVSKSFIFQRGQYDVAVHYTLYNQGSSPWNGYFNTQLIQTNPAQDQSDLFHISSFTGAAYSDPAEHRYKKITFKDMSKTRFDADVTGGWIAMQQHYFLSTWIPEPGIKNSFYTRTDHDDYTIGFVSPRMTLNPGAKIVVGAKLYMGPEDVAALKKLAPYLDLTVDYGWLWFLASGLYTIMDGIYSVVGNWGWTIILVTILVKLIFYKLSARSYRSMAGMRSLQPKLELLKQRFGDDKAKMSQATMQLYREEKINPLGGCLPIVVQIPVFIALYWVLISSVQLRQSPFILWIKDLSSPDTLHILPIIMGLTMFIQQKLNPAPADPMQAKVMLFLPLMFIGLFWNFPAGLVLYWIVNNSLSILQQWMIARQYLASSMLALKKKK